MVIHDEGDRNRYWDEQIRSRGFEFEKLYYEVQSSSYVYRKGSFKLTMNPRCRYDDAVYLIATIDRDPFRQYHLAARVRVMDPDDVDVHAFLDALGDPELLPTLVGIEWAQNFLEQYLLHESEITFSASSG